MSDVNGVFYIHGSKENPRSKVEHVKNIYSYFH